MSEEFKAITTQEELDAVIGSRIKRERETVSKEFAAQLSEKDQKAAGYEKQIGELGKQLEKVGEKDKAIEELTSRVKGYETASVKTRIAHEAGLPYELSGRLSGEDEESIRKDAESLKKLIGSSSTQFTSPLANKEPVVDDKNAALRETLHKIKGE